MSKDELKRMFKDAFEIKPTDEDLDCIEYLLEHYKGGGRGEAFSMGFMMGKVAAGAQLDTSD